MRTILRRTLVLIGPIALALPGLTISLTAQTPCASTVVGQLRIEFCDSATYGDRRTIRIWLPPGYEAPEKTAEQYPVLYMFDGQTLFDACTAFANEQEMNVDESLTRLIAAKVVRPLIVVGIDSSSRRSHEYRVFADVLADPTAPEPIGGRLPSFLVNEVMPYVSARYRVTSDPSDTAIGGTSLGAIAALYVLLNRSDRFGVGLLQSPTLPLGNGQMLRDTAFLARGPDRIYIGVGATELAVPGGDKFAAQLRTQVSVANAGFAKMAEALAGHLRAAYLNRPEVTLVVDPDGSHRSASWVRRFPDAVTVLFGPRPQNRRIDDAR